MVPVLKPVHWRGDSDRTDYNIEVCCGWITKLIYLINGTLIDKISIRLENVIRDIMRTEMHYLFEPYLKTQAELFPETLDDYLFQWSTVRPPFVTEKYVGMGTHFIFDEDLFAQEQDDLFLPEMPYYLEGRPEHFQNYVSTFEINSFFEDVVQTHTIGGWVHHSELPESDQPQLTTTGLSTLLPGIVERYGPDVPVNVQY